jgi:hypothetical protein
MLSDLSKKKQKLSLPTVVSKTYGEAKRREESLKSTLAFYEILNDLARHWTASDKESERRVAIEFVRSAPLGGMIPAQQPYKNTRDQNFMNVWYVGRTLSKIDKSYVIQGISQYRSNPDTNVEDAREAIFVGNMAGYSDADIAAYLRHVYVLPDKCYCVKCQKWELNCEKP